LLITSTHNIKTYGTSITSLGQWFKEKKGERAFFFG